MTRTTQLISLLTIINTVSDQYQLTLWRPLLPCG